MYVYHPRATLCFYCMYILKAKASTHTSSDTVVPCTFISTHNFLTYLRLLCPAVLCPLYTGNLTANVLVSVVSGSGYGVGTVLAFSCYGNNHIVGDRAISCLTTGVWNGTVPLCTCCRNLGQHLLTSQIKHYLF